MRRIEHRRHDARLRPHSRVAPRQQPFTSHRAGVTAVRPTPRPHLFPADPCSHRPCAPPAALSTRLGEPSRRIPDRARGRRRSRLTLCWSCWRIPGPRSGSPPRAATSSPSGQPSRRSLRPNDGHQRAGHADSGFRRAFPAAELTPAMPWLCCFHRGCMKPQVLELSIDFLLCQCQSKSIEPVAEGRVVRRAARNGEELSTTGRENRPGTTARPTGAK